MSSPGSRATRSAAGSPTGHDSVTSRTLRRCEFDVMQQEPRQWRDPCLRVSRLVDTTRDTFLDTFFLRTRAACTSRSHHVSSDAHCRDTGACRRLLSLRTKPRPGRGQCQRRCLETPFPAHPLRHDGGPVVRAAGSCHRARVESDRTRGSQQHHRKSHPGRSARGRCQARRTLQERTQTPRRRPCRGQGRRQARRRRAPAHTTRAPAP